MKETLCANLGIHILEVEITTRCNLNCKHCYNRTNKYVDLPTEKFVELYNFANKNKVRVFVISGGEAILHHDFDDILSFIKNNKHNFKIILQTNGLLINDDIIKKLQIFDLIHISYDLIDTLRKGSGKNLKLAKKLKRKGINCYLFVTINKTNRHLIDKMVEEANNNKIPIGFNLCVPTHRRLDFRFIMSKIETIETEKKLYNLFLKNKILRYTSPLIALFDRHKRGIYQGIKGGCTAGIAACVVSAEGELYPCPFFRLSAGNIFKNSLVDIWLNSKLLNHFRDRRKFKEPCKLCEFLSYCGGCRSRAYKDSGNLLGPDPMCYKNIILKN